MSVFALLYNQVSLKTIHNKAKNAYKTDSVHLYFILLEPSSLLKKNACFGACLYSAGSQQGT